MMRQPDLVLRDVHDVPVPSLWPLAPGWWAVILVVVLLTVLVAVFVWRARQRRQRANALFDAALAQAESPAQRLQAMSDLLRRAARGKRASAETLSGAAWLAFLEEGMPAGSFTALPGAYIESGLYVPEVDPAAVSALEVLARARFMAWMTGR